MRAIATSLAQGSAIAATGCTRPADSTSARWAANGDSLGCDDGGTCRDGVCVGAAAAPWGLNDVSVLFPVGDADVPLLLGAVNQRDAEAVTMLDESVFTQLGVDAPFLTETPNRNRHYGELRLSSFRLDPCVDGFDPHGTDCNPRDSAGDAADVAIGIGLRYLRRLDSLVLRAVGRAVGSSCWSTTPPYAPQICRRPHCGCTPCSRPKEWTASSEGRSTTSSSTTQTPDAMTKMTFMATGRSGKQLVLGRARARR